MMSLSPLRMTCFMVRVSLNPASGSTVTSPVARAFPGDFGGGGWRCDDGTNPILADLIGVIKLGLDVEVWMEEYFAGRVQSGIVCHKRFPESVKFGETLPSS